MIELFKIIKGVYDPACVPHFKFSEMSEDCIRTRGNNTNFRSIIVIMT